MKAILFSLISLILSAPAFASGSKYICKETGVKPGALTRTFILTQYGDADLEEGRTYAFSFQIFDGISKQPSVSSKVFVSTEDVMLAFGNSAEKISGTIYLDEMTSAYLTLAGKNISMDCR